MILLMLGVSQNQTHAQSVDPAEVLQSVLAKQDQIMDYQVNIEIELDVDFINMPVKHAVMYYKRPHKIKYTSDEFIMLPKKGMHFSLRNILKDDFTSIFTGYEYIDQRRHYTIKVIPAKKKSAIVLATIWVDAASLVISKVENNTRSEGSYILDFTYGQESELLPAMIKIAFEMEDFNIPLKFIGKPIKSGDKKLKQKGKKTGIVYIRFSGYKINSDLSDDIFEQEPEIWTPK
jgi:hypothetical protein